MRGILKTHCLDLSSQVVEVLHRESVKVFTNLLELILDQTVVTIVPYILAYFRLSVRALLRIEWKLVFSLSSKESIRSKCIKASVVVVVVHSQLEDLLILHCIQLLTVH